jgi:cation diffusion facilitator family transporter
MHMNVKVKVARLSVISNTLLILMKVVVGIISGSVSILSEAIHSGMDLVAAIIAYFSVRMSDTPSDSGHPYGHGKIENVSGVIEAVLIFAAAFWIIYEAIKKILHPGEVESIGWGSLVMLISAGINWLVSRRLYKVALQTESVALEADALHLKTDVYTSLGVAVGLCLIWITNIHLLDPIVAILVALLILKESYNLMQRAFNPLLDSAWEKEEYNRLIRVLDELSVSYHNLKTRKAGQFRFVDFHLEMQSDTKLGNVHSFCDSIEARLQKEFSNLEVTIHAEPLEKVD